jgi:MutS2 family protein
MNLLFIGNPFFFFFFERIKMNNTTFEMLEFDKIKANLAEYAISRAGKGMLEELQPSLDSSIIEGWLEETTEAVQLHGGGSSGPLHSLAGIEQVMEKLGKTSLLLTEDITVIYDLLVAGKKMKKFMQNKVHLAPRVSSYALSITELDDLTGEIEKCINNGKVSDKASPELARIRRKITATGEKIKAKLNALIGSPGLRKYLQDNIISMREGRYVLPVRAEHKNKVPGTVLDCSASGSTVFIEPEAIRKQCSEFSLLIIQEEKEVYRILAQLTNMIAACNREIAINIEVMAQYDFAFAKAKYSQALAGSPVRLNNDCRILIKGGRHPLLGRDATPLDFKIGQSFKALVITGPNTGGKTVVLKTVGLLTLMVQSGLHVPVGAGSEFAVFDNILVDMGDGQSIEQSLSTFSAHIKNIKNIIQCAGGKSLIIMDEIGAGTDPSEGTGLAVAILERLWEKGSTILATTHYNQLKEFAFTREGFANGAMTFDINTLRPLYRLTTGQAGDSNAFLIALRLGMDKTIVERAHEVTYKEKQEYNSDWLQPVVQTENLDLPRAETVQVERIQNPATKNKQAGTRVKKPSFNLGDRVMISTLGQTGVVYETENSMAEVGVLYRGKKLRINHKRLSLDVEAKDLYPENYDLNIIFESKENRKKDHIMNKRHVPGLTIEWD